MQFTGEALVKKKPFLKRIKASISSPLMMTATMRLVVDNDVKQVL